MRDQAAVVVSGGDWDRWDLAVRAGGLGSARLRLAVEEHGSGRQLVRIRWWPRMSLVASAILALLCAVAVAAWLNGAGAVAATAAVLTVLAALRCAYECAVAVATVDAAVHPPPRETEHEQLSPSAPAAADAPIGS